MRITFGLIATTVSCFALLLFYERPGSAQTTFGTNIRIGYPAGDDWEPYMAADQFGHIYTVITHLTANHLQIQRSDDGGNTWTSPVTMDPTPTSSGLDPWIVVGPSDGNTAWVSYMQGDSLGEVYRFGRYVVHASRGFGVGQQGR